MNYELTELFNKAAHVSGAVGVQLSIIKDNEQLDFVYGLANAELGTPMTGETIVQIGSTTKVFNAMIIMSLVEQGTVSLDLPIKNYIPEFEVSSSIATRTITLRHLLSMSAGIDNGDYGDYGMGEDAVAKRVAALKAVPQHFEPGCGFGYSNAASDVAGYLAERVTGSIWDDLLKERILKPAELRNAASLERDRLLQRVSVGHMVDPGSGETRVIRPWAGISRGGAPAGSTLAVSAHDLARFGKLFINRGVADSGSRVVSEASIRAMMTPQIDVPLHHQATSWCLGPFVYELSEVALWGHHGGNTSGGSFLYWVPDKRGVLACTFNTSRVHAPHPAPGRLLKAMTQGIMKCAFGVTVLPVATPGRPIEIHAERYTGTYECLAGRCVVRVRGSQLEMARAWRLLRDLVDSVCLVPLGGDRFLVDEGEGSDPAILGEDMAFFGRDDRGRASNMTLGCFPSSRKH